MRQWCALFVLLLAGCTAPAVEEDLALPDTGIVPRDAIAADPAAATWHFGIVPAHPDGALAAFEWTVPPDARTPGDEGLQIDLNLHVIPSPGHEIDRAALLVYRLAPEAATFVEGRVVTPLQHHIDHAAYGAAQEALEAPSPRLRFIFDETVAPGDALAFVVAIESAGDTALFVQLEKHSQNASRDSGIQGGSLFERVVASGGGAPLTPLGTGTGFRFDTYVQGGTRVAAADTIQRTVHTPDLDVTAHPLEQQGPARTVAAASPTREGPGWTLAMAYVVNEDTLGRATLEVEAQGERLSVDVPLFPRAVYQGGKVLIAEGEGRYALTIAADHVHPRQIPTIAVLALHLDATITSLLGVPGTTGAWDVTEEPFDVQRALNQYTPSPFALTLPDEAG